MPGLFFRSRLPMRQALLIVDVQPCFAPPDWLLEGIGQLLGRMPSVASVERHDESRTPFQRRKLPRQAGISKVELPATRWRYSAGV
ncbi:hypothetical protein OFL46_36105, partial [Pseudomonas aeruginosa]|nr:hypothetical protein [Pseudomonas aeruginosa]MCV6443199.1 hypothetical protein [Pseudomonas aeruginosa]